MVVEGAGGGKGYRRPAGGILVAMEWFAFDEEANVCVLRLAA